MSAEVIEEVVYVVDCGDCDYSSEFYATRSQAEQDAERHDQECSGGDPRTEREKFQDLLDELVPWVVP